MQLVRTIDAHGGGTALRVVVDGFPSPRGRTMGEKLAWARRHADDVRRLVMLEPRGHRDLSGAVLTEPVTPGSHAGALFMHGGGFAPALHHGIVSLATVALERGLIEPGGDGRVIAFDTVAGVVRARAELGPAAGADMAGVAAVACTLPPSFVVRGGAVVRIGVRSIPIDLAFSGACLAVVDSEAAGVGLTGRHLQEIRRTGVAILTAAAETIPFVHPADPALRGVHGVVFTGPANAESSALRAVVVSDEGQVAVSPTESGTAAIVTVLDAIGLLQEEGPVTVEGLTGISWSGRIGSRTAVGDYEAIVPEVRGAAWLTGEHTFLLDPGDPLASGFSL